MIWSTSGFQKINTLKKVWTLKLILLLLLESISGTCSAQFVTFGPTHLNPSAIDKTNTPAGRQANFSTLPFWDDFSKGIQPSKWITDGVSYTESIGNKAPTIGMVLFNGVNESGRAYSLQEKDQGESDFLTSVPLDLSAISDSQRSSLYLSFYWQAGGKSEAPDPNDRLTLQVLTEQGTWLSIWEKRGGDLLDPNEFTQEIVAILPEWQHRNFQFRFFNAGRQSGPFDSWLIDYVYLNTGRDVSDLTYPDRALTLPTSVKLGDYSAFPWELLQKNQANNWSSATTEFQNLENRFRAMEYSVLLRDSSGTNLLAINTTTPFNPVPNALERRTIISRAFTEIPVPKQPGDVFFETSLVTGDGPLTTIVGTDTTRYNEVDFRANDLVSTKFPLRDFFAYDRGAADYTAGINQRSGQLAVAYATPEPAFLTGISIDFSNPRQVDQVLDLVVWSSLENKPLYSEEVVIPSKSTAEALAYFQLKDAVPISGTFYIGYTQFTNDFLQVGLDKTQNFGDRIYYNIGGGWVQNKDVEGTLLIRPHVRISRNASGENNPKETTLKVFPNPTTDKVTVEGEFSQLQVLDSFGREINLPRISEITGEVLNFRDQLPGLYLIKVIQSTGVQSFRILVKK